MNEQDNFSKYRVQEGCADFVRGDVRTLLGRFADDIEWVIPGSRRYALAGTYPGAYHALGSLFFSLLSDLTECSTFGPTRVRRSG